MKKIDFLRRALLVLLCCPVNLLWAQAAWTGMADNDWHNVANWAWEDGTTGIPDATTDVVLGEAFNYPVINPGQVAVCKNMTGEDFYLELIENASLEVYGDIISTGLYEGYIENYTDDWDYALEGKIIFKGGNDQSLDKILLIVGRLIIDKTGGDVTLNAVSGAAVIDSLIFKSDPVEVGSPAVGNIVIDGGILFMDIAAKVSVPAHAHNEVPPHVVSNTMFGEGFVMFENMFGYFPLRTEIPGINGTVEFPIGASAYSYTPATVTQSGFSSNLWAAFVENGTPSSCDDIPFNPVTASQVTWHIMPLSFDFEGEGELILEHEVTTPADIQLVFNQANVGHDVSEDFDNSDLVLFYTSGGSCSFENDVEVGITEGVVTMSSTGQTAFPVFNIASEPESIPVIGIDVITASGVPAEIISAGGSLQLLARVLPLVAEQAVTWSIVPLSGGAVVSTEGLVTATANGVVYAKATSVADPAISDSIMISISNQSNAVEHFEEMYGLRLYPNPVTSTLNIMLMADHPELTIQVIDILGKVISEDVYPENSLGRGGEIDMSLMPSGTYFINCMSGDHRYSDKIIKN